MSTYSDAEVVSLGKERYEKELRTQAVAILADGSQMISSYYRAEVFWDGAMREAFVISAGGNILVGMAMMEGYDLHVSVGEGGTVRLTRQETDLPS
ncbi:MAG: hypothetical protein H8F28_03885 [Fibrella sp.]|nr:hypothetical protein [Armatimonadota bacterium]